MASEEADQDHRSVPAQGAGLDRKPRTHQIVEKPWLDRFRALLPPAAPILDIGCGSAAPMAAYLIGLGNPVVGINSSPAMIDACRRHYPGTGMDRRRYAQACLAAEVFRHPGVGQFLSPLPGRPAQHVPGVSRACVAQGGADVHKRSRAWGGDREICRRAAWVRSRCIMRASIPPNIVHCSIGTGFAWCRMSLRTPTAAATPSGSRSSFETLRQMRTVIAGRGCVFRL